MKRAERRELIEDDLHRYAFYRSNVVQRDPIDGRRRQSCVILGGV